MSAFITNQKLLAYAVKTSPAHLCKSLKNTVSDRFAVRLWNVTGIALIYWVDKSKQAIRDTKLAHFYAEQDGQQKAAIKKEK